MTYIVIHQRIWMNAAGHGVDYHSDIQPFDVRSEAIHHGWQQVDSDDFNVGTLDADGRLAAFGWGEKDFGPDQDGEPHGGYDLGEIARHIGLIGAVAA